MKNQYKLTALSSAVIAALTFATPLMAQEGNAQDDKEVVEQVAAEAGEEVVVRDTMTENLTSFQQLNREDIANRPRGDGNITDLLRSNPNVQFSNSASNSLQMGNIRPADISIHGNLSYQTNYTIDGISANSDLDPARNLNGRTVTHLDASDEQGFYVDAGLVESVTVYDNNVPVEFGGFTGGVVDTQTRSWSGENHFRVYARATEMGWSEKLVDPKLNVDSSDATMARPGQFQNDFDKRTVGFTGEFGITDNLGVVVGYSHRESKIPQIAVAGKRNVSITPRFVPADPEDPYSMDSWAYDFVHEEVPESIRDHKQTADNMFVKGTMYVSDNTELNLSFNYSGFENKGFLPTSSDSDYTDSHDGYSVAGDLKHRFENALWTTTLGYSIFEDERDSETDHFSYIIESTMSDFEEIKTGGMGDLDSTQKTLTAKTKLEFDPIQYQNTSHQFTVGAEYFRTEAEYRRTKDHYRWTIQAMDMGFMQMYMPQTSRFKAMTTSTDFQQLGLFAQHTMEAGDWTFRTGVRGEYNDFTEEFNFAPRFTAAWDILGNNKTVATFGANRYYGRTILAYALYGAQNAGLEHGLNADGRFEGYYVPGQAPEGGWKKGNDHVGLDNLETPYDDELSLGLTQRLPADLLANVTYVHRKGEKGVRSWQRGNYSTGTTTRYFDNTGKTEHDSVTFSLSNSVPYKFIGADHSFRLSAAWQETTSNMSLESGYNDLEVSDSRTFDPNHVMYDGKLIDVEDMDATDFNVPIRLMLETTHTWNQYGVTWFNFLRFDGSRDQAVRPDSDAYDEYTKDGVNYKVAKYEKLHFGSNWAWDTKLQYRPDWARGLEVAMEVTNVLNNKNVVDSFVFSKKSGMGGLTDTTHRYDIYEPGRQLWLEISYNY